MLYLGLASRGSRSGFLCLWLTVLVGLVKSVRLCFIILAATWQNQKNESASSEDSDQPGRPPSLIRVFAVRMKTPWVRSCPLSVQRRLWSDWADAQADLSLRWAHTHFVGFVMSWLKLICMFAIRISSGVKITALSSSCVHATDHSKAVLIKWLLFCVDLWFLLRGVSCRVLPYSLFVCSFSLRPVYRCNHHAWGRESLAICILCSCIIILQTLWCFSSCNDVGVGGGF